MRSKYPTVTMAPSARTATERDTTAASQPPNPGARLSLRRSRSSRFSAFRSARPARRCRRSSSSAAALAARSLFFSSFASARASFLARFISAAAMRFSARASSRAASAACSASRMRSSDINAPPFAASPCATLPELRRAISSTFSAPLEIFFSFIPLPPYIANTCLPIVTTVSREKIHSLVALAGL